MEENNKIIAEFMGFTFEKNIGYYDNDMLLSQIIYDQQNGNCFDVLLFYKSWDWLIPVVKEIREITNVKLSVDQFITVRNMNLNLNPYDYDIEQVYEAVVKFINFYNKQKEE